MCALVYITLRTIAFNLYFKNMLKIHKNVAFMAYK